jgi:hypothetical protein
MWYFTTPLINVGNGSRPSLGTGSTSQLYLSQIGGPGSQYTRTVNSSTFRWKSPNPSELGKLSAGPSVDLYDVHVFAVGQLYIIKITHLPANNVFWHVLQSATLIILDSVIFLLYIVFLTIKVVNSSVMSSFILVKP